MRPVFNSLGSNYSLSFVLQALFAISRIYNREDILLLEKTLSRLFKGKAYAFYKGRDAIEFALSNFKVGKGDRVLTQAFTCWAIEEAIIRSGAEPVFVDLDINHLNPSVKNLKESYKDTANVKAVIIQHTFGYPADIEPIRLWCEDHQLILIEDLAQAMGAKDNNSREVGSLADAVVISFGRDKVIDSISGGACIIKKNRKELELDTSEFQLPPLPIILRDLIYPLLTFIIRRTYKIGLGKFIHYYLTRLQLISSPVSSPVSKISLMPGSHAFLTLKQLDKLNELARNRKRISKIYCQKLKKIAILEESSIKQSVNLRFPIKVNNPDQLIKCLETENIYLADRWYKEPVDCGFLKVSTSYKKGACPNAESLSKKIVNMPTHSEINQKTAEYISKSVVKCLS